MKKVLLVLLVGLTFYTCKDSKSTTPSDTTSLQIIKHAKGLSIEIFDTYTKVNVSNTFPESKENYTYILHKKNIQLPDSLKKYTSIEIPIKKIITTSTTHIPSLEMLDEENTLKGFPGLHYISAEKTRQLIDAGKVREIGSNQSLNTEVILDIQPDVIIGYNVDSDSKAYTNLEKNGLKVVYNSEWTEKSPLGRAEWIKLFGALYDKNELANDVFSNIEKEYEAAKALAQKQTKQPTVMAGAIYKDQWYLPQGDSWAAYFLKEANCNYLWKETTGTGSLSLSFETVLDKAKEADFWIGPGQFTSTEEILESNSNYKYFKAFQNKNIYSFSNKKGKTGGVIYFELASNRPDLVLKDLIFIMHPEALPNHELYFFEKLK